MSATLLTGAVFHGADDGGSMAGGPARAVWHTTESDPGTLAAVVRYLAWNRSAPHLVWDPSTGEIAQMIPADRAARALMHPSGTPETNRAGSACLQIEVVGRAREPFTAGPMRGRETILAWLDGLGVRRDAYSGPRMSWQQWAAFNGHCGHMHVPGNDHVDPGAIDWQALLEAAPEGNDDMWLLKDPDGPAQFLIVGGCVVYIASPVDLGDYVKRGVKYAPVAAHEARALIKTAIGR